MASPTVITIVIRGKRGLVTGEHPVCGDRFYGDLDDSLTEQIHEASCWARGHADCRCVRRLRSPS
jgi:hypothetical protein